VTLFASYLVLGLVTGCVYALISTGLVVTYTTTGIFNFAHGAIAMVAAFTYWQLSQGWHLNVVLSVFLVLVVIAPVFGLIVERVLMRPLDGAAVDLTLVVTLGLLLFLVGLTNLVWSPLVPRSLPEFFHGNGFEVTGLLISYEQVVAAGSLVVVAIGLRLLLTRTRAGIAMRAVVDNSSLLAMAGGRPNRVKGLSWAIACSLAALAGILLAAINELNVLDLTLLVVDGYAAAIIGRLRSVPMAIIGAIGIAAGQSVLFGYLP
jgi:branched-chain amino acid transport system permease protein